MEHHRLSTTTLEVSRHLHMDCPVPHTLSQEGAQILDIEMYNFTRGVDEAINILLHKPILNHEGGHYKLPPVWTNLLKAHLTPGAFVSTTFPVLMPLLPSGDQASWLEEKVSEMSDYFVV